MKVMSITGLPFLLLVLLIGALLMAGQYLAWPRWPGWLGRFSAGAPLPRVLTMIVLMLWGALVAGVAVNREYDFYSSVGDLLGRPASAHQLAVLGAPRPSAGVIVETPGWRARVLRNARQNRGTLLDVIYRGDLSGITRPGQLYLPVAFSTDPHRRFDAVEFFHGSPGQPQQFQQLLDITDRLDGEVAANRMPPVIGVFPQLFIGRTSECVNAVRGSRGLATETYLSADVPQDLVQSFRVRPGRSWAGIGVSMGGFCAVNLGLHHPERYAAAASLSGYFTAGETAGSGYLYRGSRLARHQNSPTWWVAHRAPVAPALYLFASSGASDDIRELRGFTAELHRSARALPSVSVVGAGGGHNWRVWAGALDPALDWLGGYLSPPLSPPLMETGAREYVPQ